MYNYYSVARPPKLAPYAGRLQHPLGSPVLEALPRLPRGARPIGRGRRPIGTLTQLGSNGGSAAGLLVPIAGLALLVFLLTRGPSRQTYERYR